MATAVARRDGGLLAVIGREPSVCEISAVSSMERTSDERTNLIHEHRRLRVADRKLLIQMEAVLRYGISLQV